jgi:hypothetical protein
MYAVRLSTVVAIAMAACLSVALYGCASRGSDTLAADYPETQTYLDPANIYEGAMEIAYELPYEYEKGTFGYEGLVVSDARITYHGETLPEGVALNEIEVSHMTPIDEKGSLEEGYEYYFLTYTVTNEYHTSEEFNLASSCISILEDDYRIVTFGFGLCYFDGRDLTDPDKDNTVRAEIKIGETKTYTVADILRKADVEKGAPYFIFDYTLGQHVDATVLTFLAMKLS